MQVGMLGSKVIKGVLLDETLRKISIEICLRSMESVWIYVQLRILSCLGGTELKLSIGVGGRPLSFESIIQSDPIKGQCHPEVKLPLKCLMATIW